MANFEETLVSLIGCKVINAGFTDDEFNNIPVIVVQGTNNRGSTLLAMADAEGNGTGWIHIYDLAMDEDPSTAELSKSSLPDLKGSKVVDAGLRDEDDLTGIPTIAVETPTGEIKVLMVMCDPEGNGAGWLDVQRIPLAWNAIHPYRQPVESQLSGTYQYLDISHLKNASQLKKFLSIGAFIEQTRFFPKADFVHLCVSRLTTKEIGFIRVNDNQKSFLLWSPATQWVFEENLISVWNDKQQPPVHLFDLRPIARGDMDLADWLEFLYQVRQEKSLLVHMPANVPAGTTQREA